MSGIWKGVALSLIVLILLSISYNIYRERSQSRGNISAGKDVEYQRQVNFYEQQMKKANEQQMETERQLKESARQQEILKSQTERMDLLLQRWEKQADRFDVILNKWEEQAGI